MYELFKKINSLKRTPRIGWLESGGSLSKTEDVAQHSFEVSSITLILADLTNKEIDTEKALKMAIIHDWAEAVTGDFSQEMTREIGDIAKIEIERSVMENTLLKEIQNSEIYLDIWNEYNESKTGESKLVHLADKISILIEAKELSKRGIHTEKLEKIWNTVREEVEKYTQEFPNIKELIGNLEKL